jgi:GT2 family glycosyltransferase
MNSRKLPSISIIIVNHNGKNYILNCLGSLQNLQYPKDLVEIIIVDNNSTDGSAEVIRKFYQNVKIIELKKNYGFCLPNNLGARAACGDYLVFLNNDTQVYPDWLIELVKPLSYDPLIISVVGKLLYMDNPKIVNVAGGYLSIFGGYYNGYRKPDGPEFNVPKYTGFGTGAGVLVKRDFFLKIGGFDPLYWASMEEVELGWIIWRTGYRVYYNPKALMLHAESGTYGKKGIYDPIKLFFLTRNRLLMLFKVAPARMLLLSLLLVPLVDILKAIVLKNRELRISIIRGHICFLKHIKYIKRKRAFIQRFFIKDIHHMKRFEIWQPLQDSLKEFIRLFLKG